MTTKAKHDAGPATAPLAAAFDEVARFGAANLEAFAEAGTAAAQGVGAWQAAYLAYAKGAFESGLAGAKTIASADSPQEAAAAQVDYVRRGVASWLDEAGKLSDIGVRASVEVLAPVTARVRAAMQHDVAPPAK